VEPAGRRAAVGQYGRGEAGRAGARQLTDWDEPPVRDQEALYDVVDVLLEIADGRGVSAAQVALAWLRDRPGVTALIVGARTEQQLADNLGAADLLLAEDETARLEQASRPPLIYPHWHQAKTASDRLSAACAAGPISRREIAPRGELHLRLISP
jgi:aryl-alcohol dehydrogenase-like predicted oxidoreductase